MPSCKASKFVAQGCLDLPGRVYSPIWRTIEGEAGRAESWIPILRRSPTSPESVPIEGIGNVEFEQNHVVLPDRSALDNRKVLVHVAGTSPIGESRRQVAINKPAPGGDRYRAGINQRGAIDDLGVVSRGKPKCSVVILDAGAVVTVSPQAGRPVGRVRDEQRLSWKQAIAEVPRAELPRKVSGVVSKFTDEHW